VHSPANAVLLSLVRLDCAFCPLAVTLLSRLDNQIATLSSACLLGCIRRHVFPMPHFTALRTVFCLLLFREAPILCLPTRAGEWCA
ncbi:GTPase, partial [Giardia duodenalis]